MAFRRRLAKLVERGRVRVPIGDRRPRRAQNTRQHRAGGTGGRFEELQSYRGMGLVVGLAPDDSVLLLRDAGTQGCVRPRLGTAVDPQSIACAADS